MAHYAFINENNIVVEVIVGRNENETVGDVSDWEAYYAAQRPGLTCKRTSYNTYAGVHYTDGEPSADQSKAFRGNYAGVGFTYDADLDAFIPPKPSDDAVLDEETFSWIVENVETD
jgi:hypothetical protein